MVAVTPVIVFGIFIYIFAKIKVTHSMESEVFNGLHSSVLAVRTALGEINTDPYELNGDFLMKGTFNVTNETSIVDEVKAGTGTVTTVFCLKRHQWLA